MPDFGFWPVAVQPLGSVACGTTLWRMTGRLSVTIVVKATLGLEPDRDMTLMAPEPVRAADGDLAPFLGRAEVVLTHAYAFADGGRPTPTVAVRLAVISGTPLIDKRLLVYGPSAGPGAHAGGFVRTPIALPDPGGEALGRVLDPRRPGEIGKLGPSSPDGEPAGAGVAQVAPRVVRGVLELPDGLSLGYFQQAAPDQQSGFLSGDEWVVLDGMQPDRPRLSSRLPDIRAAVRVYSPSGAVAHGPTFEVAMQADRLRIDAHRRQCWLLWRGSFPVADEASARSLTLVGALVRPGQAVWAEPGRRIAEPLALDARPGLSTPPLSGVDARAIGQRLAPSFPPPAELPDGPPMATDMANDSADTTRRLRRGPKGGAAAGAAAPYPAPGRTAAAKPSDEAPRPARLPIVSEESTDGPPETVRYDRVGDGVPSDEPAFGSEAEADPSAGTGRFVRGAVAVALGRGGFARQQDPTGAPTAAERAKTTATTEVRPPRTREPGPASLDLDVDSLDGRKTAVRSTRDGRMRPDDLPLATVEELERTLTGEIALSTRDVELLDSISGSKPGGGGKQGPG
jgi:hypothetical protein